MMFLMIQCSRNAHALITEYWKSHPNKKKAPRKSTDAKSPRRPRKSTADETSDTGSPAAAPKKRGRKSQVKAESDLENGKDMDVDEIRAPKKPRKSAATKAQSKEGPQRTFVGEEPPIGDMSQHMKMKNWEDLVSTVDTIEREAEGSLMVYFTMSVSFPCHASEAHLPLTVQQYRRTR
jgi:chromobox protein 5